MYMYNVAKKKKLLARSDIPTPDTVCKFLYDIISPHYSPNKILDNSAGDGRLTKRFIDSEIISYEIKNGSNFFEEDKEIDCDMVLFNPPFNSGNGSKLIGHSFLEHTFKLIKDKNIPVIMFTPMGFRLNQMKISPRWRQLRDEFPPITTIISLPLDIYDEVNFHSEIVCFNTNKLLPHYFLDI